MFDTLLDKPRPESMDPDLSARYGKIWRDHRHAVRDNKIVVDALPVEGAPRWGLSLVLCPRLPAGIWSVLRELAEAAGPGHAYYRPDSVHVTVRTMEHFRGGGGIDATTLAKYAEAVHEASAHLSLREIAFRGLVATSTSVLACGYPLFELDSLRRSLHSILHRLHLAADSPEPDDRRLRNTCHASLQMFGGPLVDPEAFAALIDRWHDADFGVVRSAEMRLVAFERSHREIILKTVVTI